MPLMELSKIVRKNMAREQRNALPNGLLVLKGGDLQEELKPFAKVAEVTPISDYFDDEWFKGKSVIYLPIR